MFGRLIVRLIPWWLFIAFGAFLLPISIAEATDYFALRGATASAKTAPAPDPIALARFDARTVEEPLREIAILGQYDESLHRLGRDKVDQVYALIRPTSPGGPVIAVFKPYYLEDSLMSDLSAARQPDGSVLVRGFLTNNFYVSAIKTDLARQGIMLPGPLYTVDAYFGDRESGVDARLQGSLAMVVVSWFFVAAFWIAGGVKFATWRLRRGSSRAANSPLPRAPRKKRGKAPKDPSNRPPRPEPTPRKPPSDGFADSPIKSKKGPFR